MPQIIDQSSISLERSWIKSYPVGSRIFRGEISFQVLSAGIDFLVLKCEADGRMEKVFRNTVESLEYASLPRSGKAQLG